MSEINRVAFRHHPKTEGFRTFLEIYSFELAGKPTDSNFVYYNLCDVNFVFIKIYCDANSITPENQRFSHIP